MTTTAAALIVPSGTSNCWLPVKNAIAAGTGRRSGVLVSVIANRNSFQAKMKTSRPAVTSPGRRQRDDDLAEGLEVAGAVDQRRLLELARDLAEERGEDVDGEREPERQRGEDEAEVGVVEPDVGPDLEHRGGDRDRREGGDREEDRQDQELLRQPQTGERVAGERAEDQGEHGDGAGDDRAVAQRHREVVVLEDRGVVLQRRVRRQQVGAGQVGPGLERRVDQPVEREQAEDHDQHDRDPEQHTARSAHAFSSSVSARMLPPTKRM